MAETELQRMSSTEIRNDYPLFQLYQVEIGQVLVKERSDPLECVGYYDFRELFRNKLSKEPGFEALENLLVGAMSKKNSDFCLSRLKLLSNALVDLFTFFNSEHNLVETEEIEKLSISGFAEADYLTKWPTLPNKANSADTKSRAAD